MVLLRPALPFLLLIFVWASSIEAILNSTQCNHDCVAKHGKRVRLPYPFGFSDGCKIRLSCDLVSGEIKIGSFRVVNVGSDYVVVSLPLECNRSMGEFRQLYGKNYAMTWRNSFLLQDCGGSANGSDCSIAARFLGGSDRCGSDELSCYSERSKKFIDYEALKRTNCSYVLSSVAFRADEQSPAKMDSVSLEFQRVELEWWLDGTPSCHPHAHNTTLNSPSGGLGYRCKCKEGFAGDGYADGHGCRTDCNASRFMSGRCPGQKRTGPLIVGFVAGACLLGLMAFICYCIRRRSKFLKGRMSAKQVLCEAAGGSSVPMFRFKEIERATNSFSEKQMLGTGAYGTVYAGKLHCGEYVAIKRIRHRDNNSIEQVTNEIKLLSSVSHQNLVRLLGCCIENGEQILVYEYMPNGTLSQHLQRERGSGLPWTIRLTIATETAHAIAHLHAATNPPIYHRDIKSSNILLDYNFNSKVADFGLSRFGMMDDSHISTAPQGTPGYVDPQYHQNFHLSDKSDVYSFGVVLVEIITAMKVVDFSRPHSEINLAALAIDRIGKGRVDEILDPFVEPHRDAWTLSSIHKVAELAFRCLAFHRDMRPSMIEVASELEQIRLSGWAPMDENIGMMSSEASSCSSPYTVSEKIKLGTMSKKAGVGSWNLIVPQRAASFLTPTEDVKDSSPVSVQETWLSEESSPSTNSLLANSAR